MQLYAMPITKASNSVETGLRSDHEQQSIDLCTSPLRKLCCCLKNACDAASQFVRLLVQLRSLTVRHGFREHVATSCFACNPPWASSVRAATVPAIHLRVPAKVPAIPFQRLQFTSAQRTQYRSRKVERRARGRPSFNLPRLLSCALH